MTGLLHIADEVATALSEARPVVALETTLVAHGFPAAQGAAVGRATERRVRDAGAVPATIGVLDGAVVVGLSGDELGRFSEAGSEARKVGPRDLAACAVQGALGATTVGGTLAVCRLAGIRFLGTGGLGGVHRGWETGALDVSADLVELARAEVLVVSSGVKSLLDVRATFELLEALGVPVLAWRTNELPLFYAAGGGVPAPGRLETPAEAAAVARAHWELTPGGGLLVARPPDESVDVTVLIEEGLSEARAQDISGQGITPFVLGFLHERSAGETLRVNAQLVAANAALAAEIAVAYGGGA